MEKRGISPIIATVILIGFVVLVIGLIWLWGRGVYEERTEKNGEIAMAQIDCTDAKIDVSRESNRIVISNVGGVVLSGFVLREDLNNGNVRLTDVYVDVEVGGEFPLVNWGRDCDAGNEPSSPGSYCGNAITIKIVPGVQPVGRGAPLVSCADAAVVIKP